MMVDRYFGGKLEYRFWAATKVLRYENRIGASKKFRRGWNLMKGFRDHLAKKNRGQPVMVALGRAANPLEAV